MLYRCITNIERIFDKKKRQTASFSNIFGKISDFMCQTPGPIGTLWMKWCMMLLQTNKMTASTARIATTYTKS